MSASNPIADQKFPSCPHPTSCGPGNHFLSYRGKSFKRPAAFAVRKFPKGCGPCARNPSRVEQKLIDVVKSSEEVSFLRDFAKDGKRLCVRRIEKVEEELGVEDGVRVCENKVEEIKKVEKKVNGKRAVMPDLGENGQLGEVRGDRVIVLGLMAAKSCPWMLGKGRGSIGLQSRQKKQRSIASGNSN